MFPVPKPGADLVRVKTLSFCSLLFRLTYFGLYNQLFHFLGRNAAQASLNRALDDLLGGDEGCENICFHLITYQSKLQVTFRGSVSAVRG